MFEFVRVPMFATIGIVTAFLSLGLGGTAKRLHRVVAEFEAIEKAESPLKHERFL